MKKKLIIPYGIPKVAYNQWVKMMLDEDFWKMTNGQRKLLTKLPKGEPTTDFTLKCNKAIQKYLTSKKIPTVWKTPIYNLITKYILDFPLHNSISLFVGTQEVTGAAEELIKIKNTKTGEIMDKKTISLVISSKVSAEQIIQFVKTNKKEIEMWQDFYELPEYKNPVWKRTNLALDIIEMKDKKGMSFSEISSALSDNEDLSDDVTDFLSSTDNIKTIYYRYKKHFKIK